MMLEAVWYKNGKEVCKVSPVLNIVCDDNMDDILDIEIYDGKEWHSCESHSVEANDFEIRIKSIKAETKKGKKN